MKIAPAAPACIGSVCESKKSNGGTCQIDAQCESEQCVDGSCCSVASCDVPASCFTGECLCGGQTCKTGEACITWYEDADNDGFGDPNSAAPGCAGSPPSGGNYVTNDDDCYDNNAAAKPGQKQTFTKDRGDGSFDYDCDGKIAKKYKNVAGLSCKDCHEYNNACKWSCGFSVFGDTLYSMGFECNLPGNCGGVKTRAGFSSDGGLWRQCAPHHVFHQLLHPELLHFGQRNAVL